MSEIKYTSNPFLAILKNHSLKNPEFWKRLQSLILTVIAISPFLRTVFPSYAVLLDEKMLNDLVTALAALALYFTHSTTAKI